MTPAAFIEKWSSSQLRERQGAQEHFIDLCRLLGEPTPAEADPVGDTYCFERGASKAGGGDGWADVWRRGRFGWEYKGKHKDLNAALRQLTIYAADLENPPYLVTSDMERIVVHTNWTNTVRRTYEITFDDLREPAKRDLLRQVFQGSDALKPGLSPQELTATVATRFGDLGRRLQERGEAPEAVAHFLNRVIFCMFAEDSDLLPRGLFTRMVLTLSRVDNHRPARAAARFDELFAAMRDGDFFGADDLRHFNGGLFDEAPALPLEREDLKLIGDTAREHDWSNLDPAVLGTMFETALKVTGRRAALGAHYTDREKIGLVVDPVIVRPLAAEWAVALDAMKAALSGVAEAEAERAAIHEAAAAALGAGQAAYQAGEAKRRKALGAIEKKVVTARADAKAIRDAYLDRLAAFRVLDPACGSGNFLYVALHALRDLELRALLDADRLGIPQERPRVGLDAVRGIEIEPYAAELARVTLWIGNLQWERRNGYTDPPKPVLSTLDTIEPRDALLDADGLEASWPPADVIIGNPPFVGDRRMISLMGEEGSERLRRTFVNRVPRGADLVCYWIEKAWQQIQNGQARRAGLVTTNSIRGGANRRVLDIIASANGIHESWADQPWSIDGAAVRVSIIGFGDDFLETRSEDLIVQRINPDLTTSSYDLTEALKLSENDDVCIHGSKKIGSFDIDGALARSFLLAPLNPNGKSNSEVVRPVWNGSDVAGHRKDRWIIDFGIGRSEIDSSLFEKPFEYVRTHVASERLINRNPELVARWWLHGGPRPALRTKMPLFTRLIATPAVSKHRVFVFVPTSVLPDAQLMVTLRDDDSTFGVLHSRFHDLWALRMGTSLEDRPRYTPSTTFETFPFPEGLTPNIPAAEYADDPRAQAIAAAAAELDRLREAWLNPPDLVRIEPEVYPTAAMLAAGHPKLYPDRVLPVDEAAAKVLKTRTLTNLYNARPAWLANAHRALDEAVAAAYGWPADLLDDEVLARLFALNQERAAAGR